MTLLVLLLVIIFLSLLVHVVPGDPATTILGPRATPGLIEKMRAAMDLDKPIVVQIGNFLLNILHGSLGVDAVTGVPITKLIGSALPHTLILAITSLSLAILVGIPMGVFSATHPDSFVDRVLAVISISFTTIPSYVAGLFLLLIFAVELHALPAMGIGKSGDTRDYLEHLILPSVALAITSGPPGAYQSAGGAERNVCADFSGRGYF
jgi:peptide/nickel transport system permease protein